MHPAAREPLDQACGKQRPALSSERHAEQHTSKGHERGRQWPWPCGEAGQMHVAAHLRPSRLPALANNQQGGIEELQACLKAWPPHEGDRHSMACMPGEPSAPLPPSCCGAKLQHSGITAVYTYVACMHLSACTCTCTTHVPTKMYLYAMRIAAGSSTRPQQLNQHRA